MKLFFFNFNKYQENLSEEKRWNIVAELNQKNPTAIVILPQYRHFS